MGVAADPLRVGAAQFATLLRTVRPPIVLLGTVGCGLDSDVPFDDLGYNLLAYKSPRQIRDRIARDAGASALVVHGAIPADIVDALDGVRVMYAAAYITNERKYRASRAEDSAADVRAAITANRAAHDAMCAATSGNMVTLLVYRS